MLQTFKHIAKRSLQHIAANFGPHTRANAEPQLLILMYHRILPKNDNRARLEEPGMMVTPETFDMHLHILQQRFDIISLNQWIKRKQNGETLPPRCCAITFDDGWADNYEFAYPLLKKHQLPATIFLVSDMIGSNQQFWPERIARLITGIATQCPQQWQHPSVLWLKQADLNYPFGSSVPDQEQLSKIIGQLKSRRDDEIHQLIDIAEAELPGHINSPSLLDWQQMTEMQKSGLIDAGSHTRRHIRLNQQQPEERLLTEIIDSKRQIEQQLKQNIDTFCYPNGDHCEKAVTLVKQNYRCAVTTDKGWNNVHTDNHLLHRIGVHEDISADKTAFLACLSGWM